MLICTLLTLDLVLVNYIYRLDMTRGVAYAADLLIDSAKKKEGGEDTNSSTNKWEQCE